MTSGNRKSDPGTVQVELGLEELCSACSLERGILLEWVQEGVVIPRSGEGQRWVFGGRQIRRARIACRLQRDLGVETASLPLVMDLLDEVHSLRNRLRILERHLTED